jgi:DNA primase
MAFSPDFLDELRNRLSLADIIGRRVRLVKRGREHVGLCPFHNEKSPSFTVSEEKGFFHCFGCGAHGDVVGFAMRADGLSFPEAVERLAEQAGLPVPQATPAERDEAHRRATLLDAQEAATRWFIDQLGAAAGRAARDYLAQRGLDESAITRFRLGYAPDSRAALRSALTAAGMPVELLIDAGLLIRPEEGEPYDRFRGRIMFPIADRRGRTVGFGGRTLGDGEPKYLNSPETPLFHKGRLLYGLAQARQAIQDRGTAVVVEGYMDAIALAQGGLGHAVAPLGTALTEEQILLLWQVAPEPILCFDGDAAGERAALRALERALPLLQPGRSLRFALLPSGDDPDSLVRRAGPKAMEEILAGALPLDRLVWQIELGAGPCDTPERRTGLRRRLDARAASIAERTVAEAYRQAFAKRLDEAFGQGIGAAGQPWRRGRPANRPPAHRTERGGQAARRGVAGDRLQQEALLAALLNHPPLISRNIEALAGLSLGVGELDRLRRAIIDVAAGHPDLDSSALRGHLDSQGFSAAVVAIVARTKVHSPLRPSASPEEAGEFLAHLIGLLAERGMTEEAEASAKRLAEEPGEESLRRFEDARRQLQGGESKRRDVDRGPVPATRKN